MASSARPIPGASADPPGLPIAALVASLGGLSAISVVLAALPAEFPARLLVVQHSRISDDPQRLTQLLGRVTSIPVRTALRGTPLGTPGITVVPGGYLAGIDSTHRLTLTEDASLRGGDTLLTGMAQAFGPAAIAVVLTGMLHDGAQGVRAIKRHGGHVIVQEPSGARAGSMPSSAIATGCVDLVLPLERIAPALVALTMTSGGADLLPPSPRARLDP